MNAAGGRALLTRAGAFTVAWWALNEGDLRGVGFGVVAVAAAVWASWLLAPPAPWRLRIGPLVSFAGFFVRQSVLGGVDVARRAFDPRLPIDPGFVVVEVDVPAPARPWILGVVSLLPGTIAADLDGRRLLLHVLDRGRPAAGQVHATAAHLRRLSGPAGSPGG